jgi:hypothetical protein
VSSGQDGAAKSEGAKSLWSPAGQTIGATPELQLLPPDGHSSHAEQGVLVKLGPTLKTEGWGTRKVKNVREILRTKSAKSLRSPAGQTIGATPELQLLPPDGHSNHAEDGMLVKLGPTLKIEGWGTSKVKNVWEIVRITAGA